MVQQALDDIRLMHFTVATLNLRADADRWLERLPLVVAALHALQADVIGLQEVRLNIQQAHLVAAALNNLDEHKQHAPYRVFLAKDWYQPHILGNALLTRLPVILAERLELPFGYRTAQRVRVRVGRHLVDVANTHLHHKPSRTECIRLPQMQRLLSWLCGADAADASILMGDLNARPGSSTLRYTQRVMRSAYASVHPAEPPLTFPTPLRRDLRGAERTVDYVLYTMHGLQPVAARLFADAPHPDDPYLYASDHFGVAATFALRDVPQLL